MEATATANNLNHEIVDAFRATTLGNERLREIAIEHFEQLGFPGTKSEEYRFTPITRSIEKNFAVNHFAEITTSSLDDITPFLISSYETNLVVFLNGQYQEKLSSIISPKEQVIVQSLRSALDERSAVVLNHFAKLVDSKMDPFAALNTAFWHDGVFIHVPKHAVVEKPIVVLHVHDAGQNPVFSKNRVLMIMEEYSEASILLKSDSIGNNPVFSTVVEEIEVMENARLNYFKIQNDQGALHQVTNTMIHQNNASRVNSFTFTMNGRVIRNNLSIAIDGERCESHFYGLYLLDKNTIADNHTVVDHRRPNSFSNELYKGVMDGSSKGVFNGKIYVRPFAQKTNAFQSNRNILLSDTASINTKPQLEIWADDVKCSHGCTTGQLDEEALFYLQSRGISKHSAQAMLLYAFAGEITQPVKDETLKNYLDQLISERLHKSL